MKLILLFLLLTHSVAHTEPLKVVASFSILADITREIGGERVEVTALVGPNEDAHHYQPTPQDVRALSEADLLIINGLGFEGWITRLRESAGYRNLVVSATAGIEALKTESPHKHNHSHHGHDHGEYDPHAWHDPRLGALYAQNIANALIQIDSEHREFYTTRLVHYRQQLIDLHEEISTQFASLPATQRRVISHHNAFRYFAVAYDIDWHALTGISTEAEPNARQLAQLIRQVRDSEIRVFFLENIANPRLIRQLAREARGTLGGTLYSDALSDAAGDAPTYLQLLRHNAQTLFNGLNSTPHPPNS